METSRYVNIRKLYFAAMTVRIMERVIILAHRFEKNRFLIANSHQFFEMTARKNRTE